MSGISSGVGLISGINSAELIDQLMQIEARPIYSLQDRVAELTNKTAAWMSISAGLLSLKLGADNFSEPDTFDATKVISSDSGVLTATADAGASLGTYQFTVRRLVQSHQLISAGLTDTTPVGAGTITLDIGAGCLNPATELGFLNGQQGVQRGTLRITDWAGDTAEIDLTDAVTVTDVLEAINNEADISVRAEAVGSGIVLTDTTGLLSGTLTVAEVGGGTAAADLGILGSAIDTALTGSDVNSITVETSLDLLNDGNGIERTELGNDIDITLGDGTVLDVNLYGTVIDGEETIDYTAHTVGDVLDAINNHDDNGGKLVASIGDDGLGIKLVDTTGGGGNLVVADAANSAAATQLGIAGTTAGAVGFDVEVTGEPVIADLNSVLLANLDGGAGLTLGQLDLQDRAGNTTSVDLSGATSVADILQAINANGTVSITASLNAAGTGITLTDTTGSTANNLVVADNGGTVAAQLGLVVDDAVSEVAGTNAQHKYVSTQTRLSELNPVEPFTGGAFTITNSEGTSVTVNVSASNVVRVEDVVQAINAAAEATIGVTAGLNDSGTGLLLTDSTSGASELTVEEIGTGRAAHQLGIYGTADEGSSEIDGSFRTTLTIDADDTLDDVVDLINAAGAGVSAAVIDDGSSTNPYRLILSSTVSGQSGKVVFDTGESSLGMTTFVEARDALVYLGTPGTANAVVLTSDTNQLSGVMSGVTLDLVGTDDDPVSITVSRDTDAIVERMETFVSSFNTVITTLDDLTQFDPETMARGTLFGDASISLIRSRLVNMVLNAVDVSGDYTRLSNVGFSLEEGGSLAFDEEVFREAYAQDSTGVTALFTEAADTEEVTVNGLTTEQAVGGTGGIGAVFAYALDELTRDYDGMIAHITEGLDDQSDILNDRIEYLNELLARKRARLERQFTAMEIALAQLQSQQSSLNSLASMMTSYE